MLRQGEKKQTQQWEKQKPIYSVSEKAIFLGRLAGRAEKSDHAANGAIAVLLSAGTFFTDA